MTWTPETSCGFESDKIAPIAVPYLQGRFLDIGCGMRKVWPSAIGIDSGHHFGRGGADIQGDGRSLSMFADRSMDAVFSSHTLEHFRRDEVPRILEEWARVLKIGGHLVLYIPSGNLYPHMGEPGANPDHKWDPMPGDVEAMLKAMKSCGWELRESEERSEKDEYSLFIVARKRERGWKENVWQRNPGGKKRCLVVRYGAIGDAIVASSILPGLKEQGWHVTFNCKPSTYEVLKHDPNVDEWLLQDTDFVPNHELGPYWEHIAERYDQVVNLCESVEGSLLALPGRLQHGYPEAARRKLLGTVNYAERTHEIAGVPYKLQAKFYPAAEEVAWARRTKAKMGGLVVAWAINGSSAHKVWPWTQVVVQWLLERTPAQVVLLADNGIGEQLQDGILECLKTAGADMSRVHGIAGKWSIREALAFCQLADCVVGPETGPLNAVCAEPVPKVIYLSHSSHTNLTRDWVNTTVLEPDTDKAPCYPCHRLHSTWQYCHQDEATNAALCAAAISPMRVFESIAVALGARKAA